MDQTSGEYSVAGLMARLGGSAVNDSIGENYMSVNANRFGSNWIQARTLQAGGQNDSIGSTNSLYPRHLRLTRESNTFRAFESADGSNWKSVNWGVSAQQSTSRIFARALAAMASMQPGSRWSDRPPGGF
jgi:hypothetical protein